MQNDKAVIVDVARKIDEMNQRKRKFHECIELSEATPNLPGKLEVKFGGIRIECFDHTITATPRLVMDAEHEDILVEYDFQTDFKDKPISIWRAYLVSSGILYSDPSCEAQHRICDYNNEYIRDTIITKVAKGLLQSPVFALATGD